LSKALQSYNICSHRLHKPSLTENEDKSCLIEWNFRHFRIGLSFETDKEGSFYFFISRDDSIGTTKSETRRINDNLGLIVSSMTEFVVKNT